MIELRPHQEEAIKNLANGKILYGGVGDGKSLTALSYYLEKERERDIIVITTARKRDSLDWEGEASKLGISTAQEFSVAGALLVESWNNISKFEDYRDKFFIFDEQRLIGTGAWVKSFYKIARNNRWIILSATPGDTWLDYAPVFIANGWFRNITEFKRKHVQYQPYSKFPVVSGYIGERRLEMMRNEVLVEMPYEKHTSRVLNYLECSFDEEQMNMLLKRRWNPFLNQPVKDIGELFRLMRRVAYTHPSRLETVRNLLKMHPRLIIFYNFDYELEILKTLRDEVPVFQLNGHKHDPVPPGRDWVYLVQYVAGAEAWNCITTNATVFHSLTYSYKNFEQAHGRIDRLNTPYSTLYYYALTSNSKVDVGIKEALSKKQDFNERKFAFQQGSKTAMWEYL